ncbi:hypothetical protein EDD21DRAFT_118257 [Dissophora ornata]|nr:hypothetical protein BGZ58_006686 [Dissophora ornata]KAI8601064.1 hypothetical protein EDD21DRAFT_118257 [Dissophora ornata]
MTSTASPLRGVLDPKKTQELIDNPPEPTFLDIQPLLPPSRNLSEPIVAFTVQNILSPEECVELIKRSEQTGYEVALVNMGNMGPGVHIPGYRDGKRILIDDVDVTAELFKRVKHYLPPVFERCPVHSMNERLRFLKYLPGDKFAQHKDGVFVRMDGSGHMTKLTIQFYLNEDCGGGETTFLDESMRRAERYVDGKKLAVPPRVGQILVFQHDLLHEGSKVTEGVKYVIRNDILYGAPIQGAR